jgi:bifunctional DNase/RNase
MIFHVFELIGTRRIRTSMGLTSMSYGLKYVQLSRHGRVQGCRLKGIFMGKDLIEVKVRSIVVDPKANNPVVVLVDLAGQKALPIWIGVFEAEAISRGLEDVVSLRPMTHDLMKQILDTFQVSLDRVVINDLKGNTFYANLHLNVGGKELVVDSRPSDAIALAVRANAPIFVSESVVKSTEQLGISATHLSDEEDELTDIIDKMKPEDFGKYKM